MFNISNFLRKISDNIDSKEVDKERISEIIKKETGLDIKPESFEVKNYILYIQINPSYKNKIFINKSKILEEIAGIPIKIIDIK